MTATGTRKSEMRLGLLPPFSLDTVGHPSCLKALAQRIDMAGAESCRAVGHIPRAESYAAR